MLLAREGRFNEAVADMRKATTPPDSARTLYQAACVNALIPRPLNQNRALSFLSPCVLPLVPPYLCYMAGASVSELRGEGDGTAVAAHQAFWFAWSQFMPGTLVWTP